LSTHNFDVISYEFVTYLFSGVELHVLTNKSILNSCIVLDCANFCLCNLKFWMAC